MGLINVIEGGSLHIGQVANLEIRTQEFPITKDVLVSEYYEALCGNFYVARISDRAVGYALVTSNNQTNVAMVDSIGTLPEFQRHGVARALIRRITTVAVDDDMCVRMLVPTYAVEDKEDPWNIEQWLWRMSFKVLREEPEVFFRYNRYWNAYLFERQL